VTYKVKGQKLTSSLCLFLIWEMKCCTCAIRGRHGHTQTRQQHFLLLLLPAAITKAGVVFNVSVCQCVCVCIVVRQGNVRLINQTVVLKTCLVVCTTCANLHQNWFIQFKNIVFASLIIDEWTSRKHYAAIQSTWLSQKYSRISAWFCTID